MIGIDTLIKLRMAGKAPDHVWINFNQKFNHPKYAFELVGLQLGYKKTNDYRPFVGLDVLIHAASWSRDVSECYEALQAYAKGIWVFIDDFGDDLGWKWDKKLGRIDYE